MSSAVAYNTSINDFVITYNRNFLIPAFINIKFVPI